MATNYFIKERITRGAKVRIFVTFRHPLRFQNFRRWLVNVILWPVVTLEIRKEIKAPPPHGEPEPYGATFSPAEAPKSVAKFEDDTDEYPVGD